MLSQKCLDALALRRQKALEAYYANPKICLYCSKIIMVKEFQQVSNIRQKKFCNHTCSAAYNNIIRYGPKLGKPLNYVVSTKVSSCQTLEDILNLSEEELLSIMENSSRLETREKTLKELSSVEGLTVSQIKEKVKTNAAFHNFVRSRARVKMFRLGKTRCEICDYSVHVEATHIKPVASFSENSFLSEINDSSNIKALCASCHWESEKYNEDFYTRITFLEIDKTLGELRQNTSEEHGRLLIYGILRAHARSIIDTCSIRMCMRCGYKKHVEVAHVQDISKFEDSAKISEVNKFSNLLALCPNCHWEFDNGCLLLETILESPNFTYLSTSSLHYESPVYNYIEFKQTLGKTQIKRACKICLNISTKEIVCKHCIEILVDRIKQYCPSLEISFSHKSMPKKKKMDISKNDLIQLLEKENLTQIGRRFNISANAVKKQCVSFQIDYQSIFDNKKVLKYTNTYKMK